MRILFISPHFPPDVSALSRRVHDLCRAWSAAGHEVHVLCGLPGHPSGVVPPAYQGRLLVHEQVDGVQVHRTWSWVTPNQGVGRRSLGFASYAVSALTVGQLGLPQPDLVVASSPQFLAAVAGVLAGLLRRVPVVVEIRDLWPQSIWEVGAISRDHPAMVALEALERWVYRSADHVVVVSAPFVAHVRAAAPDARITVITNGVDLTRFHPGVPSLRDRLGLQGPVALYAGTHGMAHGLEVVVDAARRLPQVTFALVGDGARKQAVQEYAAGVDNVRFFDSMPAEDMPGLYAAADVCLAPLRDLPLFADVIPSKIFEIWGVGKPVILGVRGEAARIVGQAGGGLVVPPEDAEALARAVERLVADPAEASRLGLAGRRAVEAEYDRAKLATRYLDLLSEVSACSDRT